MNILIVDDDSISRAALCEQVRDLGFDHICEGDPIEALQYAKVADYILLDWEMPEMDGAEFIRRVREMGVKCPITVVTGHEEADLCIDATMFGGAHDFIIKPSMTMPQLSFMTRLRTALTKSSYEGIIHG